MDKSVSLWRNAAQTLPSSHMQYWNYKWGNLQWTTICCLNPEPKLQLVYFLQTSIINPGSETSSHLFHAITLNFPPNYSLTSIRAFVFAEAMVPSIIFYLGLVETSLVFFSSRKARWIQPKTDKYETSCYLLKRLIQVHKASWFAIWALPMRKGGKLGRQWEIWTPPPPIPCHSSTV